MNPVKSKHILIGLAVAFILFLFYRIGDSYDQTGTKSPMQYQSFDRSMDWEQDYPPSSTWSFNPSSSTRHEILQTTVKGYREETYWGEHTSTAEKVRHVCKSCHRGVQGRCQGIPFCVFLCDNKCPNTRNGGVSCSPWIAFSFS